MVLPPHLPLRKRPENGHILKDEPLLTVGGSRLFLWTQLSISRVWGVREVRTFFVTKFGPIGTQLECRARRKVFAHIGTPPEIAAPKK